MLFVLAFALVYYFFGDRIFPGAEGLVLAHDEIAVSFIDVGQGESILIRSANHAVLIDGGEHAQRNAVLNYLRDAGVRRLDYVVATHPHSDHIGGLVTVLSQLEIGRVVMPDVTHTTDTFRRFLEAIDNRNIPVTIPNPGDILRVGIIELTVIGPPNPHPWPDTDLNNASIVLRLAHGRTSVLFTGDAEYQLERWILDSDAIISSSVLNVGHHGSRTSTSDAFLHAVNPRAAVISVGANNQFGHPHREVTDRLNARGVTIFRTDQLGTVRMITDGENIYFR